MYPYDETDLSVLKGEILTEIDCDENDEVILLTTESGRQFKLYHSQDCCERVYIQEFDNYKALIGKKIIEVTDEENDVSKDYYDSATETVITFRVNDATVINRWIGESNGYYSERVNFMEIK
jgi:hypothetical protein